MKIAICDDSKKDLEYLYQIVVNYYLEKRQKVTIEKFGNPKTLLNNLFLVGGNAYDVFILDIIMQENGIEIAKRINKIYPHALIIFQTGSPEFAVDAFRVRAFDYIMKPLDRTQVHECLDRLGEVLLNEKKTVFQVKTSDLSLVTIDIKNLLYIESNERRLLFHLSNAEIISTTTLRTKFLESIPFNFSEENFVECHNSFLVNMNHVKTIKDNEFVMSNDKTVPISKRLLKETKERYIKYLIGE